MIFRHRWFLVIETFFWIILPLLVLQVKPELLKHRIPVMALGLLYVLLVMKKQGWTAQTLGFTRKNLTASLKSVLLPTLFIASILIVISSKNPKLLFIEEVARNPFAAPNVVILLVYVFISVPLQEVLFRGFYLTRLQLVSHHKLFIVVYASTFFSLAHLSFANKNLSLGTFFLGLWWAKNFLKYRNLAGPIFSHAILGGILITTTLLS